VLNDEKRTRSEIEAKLAQLQTLFAERPLPDPSSRPH